MREYINIVNLFETPMPTIDELESMKATLAAKIKQLPDDPDTLKALQEIEELLSHLKTGGKLGAVTSELERINDTTVMAAQRMLARYILSIDMTPAQRKELFDLWREDKLVKRNVLLQPGKKTISDVIEKYDSNSGIKEFVDDLMRIQALGQGKGEFAFSVLSKSISKPKKGDLVVDSTHVEVKTTEGGAGRFTDQEVRPGNGFEQAANDLNHYVTTHPENPISLPGSGLSMKAAVNFAQNISDNRDFIKMCKEVINKIFDDTDNAAVNRICDAIKNNNAGAAIQEYAKLSFNYYIDKKIDDGVLYINLTKDPITLVWFKDADELAASGMRLHADTIYLTSTKDIRLPYPQMNIVDTSAAAASTAQSAAASAKKVSAIDAKVADIAARAPMQDLKPTAARAKRGEPANPTTTRQKR